MRGNWVDMIYDVNARSTHTQQSQKETTLAIKRLESACEKKKQPSCAHVIE